MNRSVLLTVIASLFFAPLGWAEDYQKIAEAAEWKFSLDRAAIGDSFLRFPAEYTIELIRKKDRPNEITIRVVDNGAEAVSFQGNYGTVFVLSGDTFIYADYYPSRTGCSLVAYDLKTRKQLWKTALAGLGPIDHFQYSNRVNLDVFNKEVVRVFSQESAGRYVEFVDMKTGKTVGHKVYGK